MLGADQVLRVKRLNLADGEPFAVVTVWCPAELGRTCRADVEQPPFYELLGIAAPRRRRRSAPTPLGRRRRAAPHPVGSPVLRCERVTTDTSGRPVLLSEQVFPAYRTEFVVELPHAAPRSRRAACAWSTDGDDVAPSPARV